MRIPSIKEEEHKKIKRNQEVGKTQENMVS